MDGNAGGEREAEEGASIEDANRWLVGVVVMIHAKCRARATDKRGGAEEAEGTVDTQEEQED